MLSDNRGPPHKGKSGGGGTQIQPPNHDGRRYTASRLHVSRQPPVMQGPPLGVEGALRVDGLSALVRVLCGSWVAYGGLRHRVLATQTKRAGCHAALRRESSVDSADVFRDAPRVGLTTRTMWIAVRVEQTLRRSL